MTQYSNSPVLKPSTEEGIKKIFSIANRDGLKLVLRGGGNSYGDAAINSEGLVVDLSNYNKILDWNEETGTIRLESGVTIQQLWEFAIEKGYWPPVVSGTMFPTIGGALSMNIHGKNNFAAGTLGEYVTQFTFLTAKGEKVKCNKKENTELFYLAIGGIGVMGCFLEIELKLKKIYSGKIRVYPKATKNLQEMLDYFEENYQNSDYLVGWIDAFASGKALGRGLIHKAVNLKQGEDPNHSQTILLKNQILPKRFFGVIPKSWMWLFLYPFTNNLGMKFVNFVKYVVGIPFEKPYLQGHAEYSFLLDYVPNWKFIYKPGSMIQYQVFLPLENAHNALSEILTTCQKHKLVSYLAVFKRNKGDNFFLSYIMEGYSLALDFPVTKKNKDKLWALTYQLDEIVLKNKGKFYFAKDSTLRPEIAKQAYGEKVVNKFLTFKAKYDPNGILQSDLFKRVFLS
ncbi:MAG: FAD-binding oxidoreductase [Leptospiraceae bacterium]|nr:FAD-binding oxidoreductase [Leptospiraceae bacterium]MCP5493829.1 FAD-binding oxidoreductase [Leptospiraceae bacterium]